MKLPDDVVAWHDAACALKVAQAKEMELRLKLVETRFSDGHGRTAYVELPDGYRLKGEFNQNVKLDPEEAKKGLQKLKATGDAGVLLADRLVGWKPELRLREWGNLDAKFKKFFSKAVSWSPATPKLELIIPTKP